MTLGQKIKEARIERKMTQRDVVGDYITRNMLSKIENDSATPSVKTLEYIARSLNLPAGYFMDDLTTEDGEPSGITGARKAFTKRDYLGALDMLTSIDLARTSHEDEACLLRAKCCLGMAERTYHEGEIEAARAYARDALKHNAAGLYHDLRSELRGCQLLMLCAIQSESSHEYAQYERRYIEAASKDNLTEIFTVIRAMHISESGGLEEGAVSLDSTPIESLDNAWVRASYLLIKARAELEKGNADNAVKMLETAEFEADKDGDRTLLAEIYTCLEQCYKQSDNFKMAYHYATLRLEMA